MEAMSTPERDMYLPYFEAVAPKGNWKEAIDAVITVPSPAKDSAAFVKAWNMTREAVAFFTASQAMCFVESKGKETWTVRVKAPGYYAAGCG